MEDKSNRVAKIQAACAASPDGRLTYKEMGKILKITNGGAAQWFLKSGLPATVLRRGVGGAARTKTQASGVIAPGSAVARLLLPQSTEDDAIERKLRAAAALMGLTKAREAIDRMADEARREVAA